MLSKHFRMEKFESALAFLENIPKNERDKIVALDCEMTGSSMYGTADRHRHLLRATVLDGHGNVLLGMLVLKEIKFPNCLKMNCARQVSKILELLFMEYLRKI